MKTTTMKTMTNKTTTTANTTKDINNEDNNNENNNDEDNNNNDNSYKNNNNNDNSYKNNKKIKTMTTKTMSINANKKLETKTKKYLCGFWWRVVVGWREVFSDGGGVAGVDAATLRQRRPARREPSLRLEISTLQIFGGQALIFRKAQTFSETVLLRKAQILGRQYFQTLRQISHEEQNYLEEQECLEKSY